MTMKHTFDDEDKVKWLNFMVLYKFIFQIEFGFDHSFVVLFR